MHAKTVKTAGKMTIGDALAPLLPPETMTRLRSMDRLEASYRGSDGLPAALLMRDAGKPQGSGFRGRA